MQTLGALKQYLAGYVQHRETRTATLTAHAARAARGREEADQIAYGQYRRQAANEVFAKLPATEQEKIEEIMRSKRSHTTKGPLADTLFKVAKARLVADRNPEKIATFEQWHSSSGPSLTHHR